MKEIQKDGKTYRIPSSLNPFQEAFYLYLIDWKWEHITEEPGVDTRRGKTIPYDAILPDNYKESLAIIYPPIRDAFRKHVAETGLQEHKYIGHMASSQAACFNLFLPLLQQPDLAAQVFRAVLPDFKSLAIEELYGGFQFEFDDREEKQLRDHDGGVGTDVDFAIAYHADDGSLNLWLIEHKLTEAEFSTCGGAKSKGRGPEHDCSDIAAIISEPAKCYYHSAINYAYWELTLAPQSAFSRQALLNAGPECPFKGGANQLWRNQLLARALENSERNNYSKVIFSVVHHPENTYLQESIERHESLLSDEGRFFTFTSDHLVAAAADVPEVALQDWAARFRALYRV